MVFFRLTGTVTYFSLALVYLELYFILSYDVYLSDGRWFFSLAGDVLHSLVYLTL